MTRDRGYRARMTNSSGEPDDLGIDDSKLPEDLQPEGNPLAEGLEAGETAGDDRPGTLLQEGKTPDGSDAEDAGASDGAQGSDDAED